MSPEVARIILASLLEAARFTLEALRLAMGSVPELQTKQTERDIEGIEAELAAYGVQWDRIRRAAGDDA